MKDEKKLKCVLFDVDGVVINSEMFSVQYQKEFYKFILIDLKKRHNIQTDEIIFFDDDRKNIAGASNVGIKSVFYKGVDDLKAVGF